VAYFGENYHGFATHHEKDDQTVETAILAAMRKIRLISPDSLGLPEGYSRCGRTDRGVSALAQVLALPLRHRSKPALDSEELDYCTMLNRVLPDDILVTAWSPCSSEFDARFKCTARTYRYYVNLSLGEIDVEAMREGCSLFEGTHDFRNFCKMDVENTTHFIRRVDSCRLVLDDNGIGYCEVKGSAFLWHQVRLMMAILFFIGSRRESPSVITRMFDVETMPRKPAYEMAPEGPLILYATEFAEALDWRIDPKAQSYLTHALQNRWYKLRYGAAIAKDVFLSVNGGDALVSLPVSHTPIEERPVGKSYEERVEALKPEKRMKRQVTTTPPPATS